MSTPSFTAAPNTLRVLSPKPLPNLMSSDVFRGMQAQPSTSNDHSNSSYFESIYKDSEIDGDCISPENEIPPDSPRAAGVLLVDNILAVATNREPSPDSIVSNNSTEPLADIKTTNLLGSSTPLSVSRSASPSSLFLHSPSLTPAGSPPRSPSASPNRTPSISPVKLQKQQKQLDRVIVPKCSRQVFKRDAPSFRKVSLSLKASLLPGTPSFLVKAPDDIVFGPVFSYLTPEDKFKFFATGTRFSKGVFLNYKAQQLSKENRHVAGKYTEESKLANEKFFLIEEIFSNYSKKLQKSFFIELKCEKNWNHETLYDELFKEIKKKVGEESAFELERKISKEVDNKKSKELPNQLMEEFFEKLPPLIQLSDEINKKLYDNLGLSPKVKEVVKNLISEFIDFVYLSDKATNDSIANTTSIFQWKIFNKNPELCDKIKLIFADCNLPDMPNAHNRKAIDFRIGMFVTGHRSFISIIFGAILTGDFALLDFALNNEKCDSKDIILGVTHACDLFAWWMDVLNENYLSRKNVEPSKLAQNIRTNHGTYFLNSLSHARTFIKYAITKAIELNQKEQIEKRYNDTIDNYTYESFASEFNKFKSAISDKDKFIKKWETFTKTKFKPSSLPNALQSYTWKWFDGFKLKYRVWRNSTAQE